MIDLGDVYRLSTVCRTPDGTPTTPESATLVVTLPDGSTEDVVPVIGDDGGVHGDFNTTQVGRHSYVLSTVDPVTAYRDVFDVRVFDTTSLMSLADARAQLNIRNTNNDDEIREYVAAATRIVESYVGATVPRSYTESSDGPALMTHTPIVEIEAIEPSPGMTTVLVDNVGYDEFGRLYLLDTGAQLWGCYTVTYRAGRTDIPANWVRAAGIILQHMWKTQRTSDPRRAAPPTTDEYQSQDAAGRHYSIPRRAVELLEPDMKSGV